MISHMFSLLLIVVSLSLLGCVSTGLTQQNTEVTRTMLEESSPGKSLPITELAQYADSLKWTATPNVEAVARQWVAQIEAYLPNDKVTRQEKPERDTSTQPMLQQPVLKRKRLVSRAMRFRGVAYRYGGSTPSGFDCSGFTQFVMRDVGIKLPRTSQEQAKIGKRVDLGTVQEGDLLFFGSRGRVTHVGIIASKKGQPLSIIHASSKGVVLTIVEESAYWRPRLLFARRVINSESYASR